MENDQSNATAIKERIAGWLAATRDVNPAVGLERAEADSRVRDLLRAILEKRISPDAIVLDEEIKQALSVLVRQLAESVAAPEERLHDADAVYQFIRGLSWPDTGFGEQRDLLAECAAIGWGAMGITLADVTRRRVETGREGGLVPQCKTDPNDPLAICSALKDQAEASPASVAADASSLYDAIANASCLIGLFDEKNYFLGEAALLAGRSFRHLGKRDDAERWFDRAEASFRHTINNGPLLVNVSYARLTLKYDAHRHEDVLELLPSVLASFTSFGMRREAAKCLYLQAMSYKEGGRAEDSIAVLSSLRLEQGAAEQPGLLGQILVDLGEYEAKRGGYQEASSLYREAAQYLTEANRPIALAHLKWSLADMLRLQGQLEVALDGYRAAQSAFTELGMVGYSASVHLATADHLLLMSRPREAEWEILAALPTIEEQKMVPEGFAAVALLKESVRQRKADPNALRELREHLQANQR